MSATIDAVALILVPALPLVLLLFGCIPALRPQVGRFVPSAALPALLLALVGDTGAYVQLPWILLGAELGLDQLNRVFLALTALLWLAAGVHARGYLRDDPHIGRFNVFWLATMAGNLGLIVARDVATFYACFALMTFSAYGLVVHTRSAEALRAGRVYLTMAVIGEGLLVVGLLLATSLVATPLMPSLAQLPAAIASAAHRDLIMACLWLGLGIKAGLPLLHMWLPLAHPVAPMPASAVLSGAMIKAGLLGWLTTLPLGLVSLPTWSALIIGTGLAAAFGGALAGIHQHQAKTVLAYSSISQMGLMTVGVGAGLQSPALWPLLGPAIALYALHHGLVKGALFLGVAIARHPGAWLPRWLLWLALALPALALAGPMTSGVLAKLTLKAALASAGQAPAWWAFLPSLLALAAVGTTALMARYLWLLSGERAADCAAAPVWIGWALLVAASSLVFMLLPPLGIEAISMTSTGELVALVWPVLAGATLSIAAWRWLHPWPVPPGDVLAVIAPLFNMLTRARAGMRRRVEAIVAAAARQIRRFDEQFKRDGRRSATLEQWWRRDAALSFAALLVVLLLVSLGSR